MFRVWRRIQFANARTALARTFLNSGVMLARPAAAPLFAEVARCVQVRLQQAPTGQTRDICAAGGRSACAATAAVWPQHVLNEVVMRWQAAPWAAENQSGAIVASVRRPRCVCVC